MMEDLKLPISCKNHAARCDFSGSLEDVIAHEEDCPYRSVKCVVLSCYQDIRFNNLETHMAQKHPKMSTGEWEIISLAVAVPGGHAGILNLATSYNYTCSFCKTHYARNSTVPHPEKGIVYCGHCNLVRAKNPIYPVVYAMRSWRHGGTRVFATLFAGTDAFWHIWVTAACGKTAAEKFRAEIRLSSNIMLECNDVSYMPVLHFESPILSESTSIKEYTACLLVHEKIVAKHIKGAADTAKLEVNTEIPFTTNVYDKVFLTLDKADIEEKGESD